MNRILLIVTIIAFLSCSSDSKNTNRGHLEESKNIVLPCEKCDFEAIKYASENYFSLNKGELEKFLCAYDENCDWPSNMMETRDNRKYGLAWEALFSHFDRYFNEFLDILENNESVNKGYLLELFSEPAIYDLPYGEILRKLKEIEYKTDFQKEVERAFEHSVNEGNRMLND
ncbi:MAG: hypothetical protein AAFY71_28335 [Bacteroidota bacterium]